MNIYTNTDMNNLTLDTKPRTIKVKQQRHRIQDLSHINS